MTATPAARGWMATRQRVRRTRRVRGWRALAAILWVTAGCGGAPAPAPVPSLAWPAPPQVARIRLVQTITRPEDLGIRKSTLRRLWDFFIGGSDVAILQPYGVASDGDARLYVADSAARVVHVFDQKDGRYRRIAGAGSRAFAMPIGVAVDARGVVYVSDAELPGVFAFDSRGRLTHEVGAGTLARPTGLAVSPAGDRLWVVDTLAHRVVGFDAAGRPGPAIGGRGLGAGQFNFPTNAFVDRAGRLYVTDSLNFRVQVFDGDGQLVRSFGHHGDGTGDLAKPKGIAVDSDGHVYVIEGLHDVLQVFDPQGAFLLAVGGSGTEPGRFWLPTGLHIDRQDRVYVADSYNRRIQVFQYLKDRG